MSLLFYSAAAEKKVATYLDMLAEKTLGAAVTPEAFDHAAHRALHQIMLDNDDTTGYSATKAEIKAEKENG